MEPIRLDHIPVERVGLEGPRKKVVRNPGGPRHPSSDIHSEDLFADVEFVVDFAREREQVLGIDPKLILVVETGPNPGVEDEKDWDRAGLRVVDSSTRKKVIAFSSDPEMTKFVQRLNSYANGPEGKQKSAPYSAFFDGIDHVRPYGRADRIGRHLSRALDSGIHHAASVLDLELWYPGDAEKAAQWVADVNGAVVGNGGSVLDSFINPSVGIVLLRVQVSGELLSQLLNVDLIATIELVAGKAEVNNSAGEYAAADLTGLPVADNSAPLVGLVDSGVALDHPLIRGCVTESVSVSEWFPDGIDRNGHGTAVASVLARGHLEPQLMSGEWDAPLCRVLSVRVLDENNELPPYRLAAHELEDAIRYLASHGVRVINLSLGDLSAVYDGDRAPILAALLDSLARELNLVFTIPTGTAYPSDYSGAYGEEFDREYVTDLANSDAARIVDPAPSMISLTVGGSVGESRVLPLGLRSVGRFGWPSPISRVGEGISGAVKPELIAPAGTLAQEVGSWGLREVDEAKVVVADGRPSTTGVLTYDIGSSFAAPVVARVGAGVQSIYPDASSNLIRALILQSCTPATDFTQGTSGLTAGEREKLVRRTSGYGTPSLDVSLSSEPRGAVLYAEDEIDMDDVHLYALPIPDSFFQGRRASRGVAVSLAYDPPVRARRLDYVGSRMEFELVRGLSPNEVVRLFLDEKVTGNVRGSGSRLSQLSARNRIAFTPSKTVRSQGANQFGRYIWKQSLTRIGEGPQEFLLAVQNTRRWAPVRSKQTYALAVRFWVDDMLPPVYAEIRSRVPRVRQRGRVRP
ncbi:S8 family peptidase [Streptomyces sp. NPDC015532]|uniref:S8 family peptidase n=1 Tax=Streptomyces sp. NPDC015532 TaxID=3364960 RepID=UPI0036FF0A75